jgi:hypothetical protein
MNFNLLICLAVVSTLLSCADNNNGGGGSVGTSPIPSMVKIAKEVLPANLESSKVSAMDLPVHTMAGELAEMKSRLFSEGPTDFLYRLYMVDSRLNELASRISECADMATQSYTPPAVVTGMSFPMEFSCKTSIDNATSMGMSKYDVYFGKKNGFWYLAEIQVNAGFETSNGEPPSIGVLAKVSEDGSQMDVWQISVEKKSSAYYAGVMHITANKTAGIFSLTTASSADSTQILSPGANFSGLGCGVQMITDSTEVYANGSFSQNPSCPSTTSVCTLADLATSATCSSLSASSSLLSLIGRLDVSGNTAKSLVVDGTGLPSF